MSKSVCHINLSDDSRVYRQFRYPAGEWQVRVLADELAYINADEVRVTARIGCAEDIVKLGLLASAIRGASACARTLILPYLPYGRADRRFCDGDCFGLQVFAGLIGSMGFHRVVTLDAHSQVASSHFDQLVNVSPDQFIISAISKFADRQGVNRVCVLYPDDGAAVRYRIPTSIGCNSHQVAVYSLHCRKKRDVATGALSGFEVPCRSEFTTGAAIIVDDICDGGGTFLGIAKELERYNLKLGLYVTHGIFSKGFATLGAAFDRIYSTNSLGDAHSYESVITFECEAALGKAIGDLAGRGGSA